MNTEEKGVGLTKVVPFLVEDELKAKGRDLLQGCRLAALRPHRRPVDHRSKSGLIGSPGRTLSSS
jgi:hypothetical protein